MCPHCGAPLIILELDGVEIDHCPACGGTWLDSGELEQIAALSAAPADAGPGRLGEALRRAGDGGKSRRRCPRCRRRLRLIRLGEAPPVTLDRCPRGHGLWLDRGEMERVIRQFTEGTEGALAGFLGRMFQHQLKP